MRAVQVAERTNKLLYRATMNMNRTATKEAQLGSQNDSYVGLRVSLYFSVFEIATASVNFYILVGTLTRAAAFFDV